MNAGHRALNDVNSPNEKRHASTDASLRRIASQEPVRNHRLDATAPVAQVGTARLGTITPSRTLSSVSMGTRGCDPDATPDPSTTLTLSAASVHFPREQGGKHDGASEYEQAHREAVDMQCVSFHTE